MRMSRLLFKAMAGLLLATIITLPLYGKESAEKAASHMNSTGMLLYYIMDRENNTVMSPLATSTSLLMTYMGARGETEKAMK
ncbi:MAG: hypothetical protein KDK60_00545, partial [Chlamydiia bacterium]|nr:hypothetical protein [Chlamydiia bacterium]